MVRVGDTIKIKLFNVIRPTLLDDGWSLVHSETKLPFNVDKMARMCDNEYAVIGVGADLDERAAAIIDVMGSYWMFSEDWFTIKPKINIGDLSI